MVCRADKRILANVEKLNKAMTEITDINQIEQSDALLCAVDALDSLLRIQPDLYLTLVKEERKS